LAFPHKLIMTYLVAELLDLVLREGLAAHESLDLGVEAVDFAHVQVRRGGSH